jgi:hypothetical protein
MSSGEILQLKSIISKLERRIEHLENAKSNQLPYESTEESQGGKNESLDPFSVLSKSIADAASGTSIKSNMDRATWLLILVQIFLITMFFSFGGSQLLSETKSVDFTYGYTYYIGIEIMM